MLPRTSAEKGRSRRAKGRTAAGWVRVKGMSRGRYSLADPDIIPVFTMTDASPRARAAAVLPFAGWLLLTGVALAVLGLRRADRWAL